MPTRPFQNHPNHRPPYVHHQQMGGGQNVPQFRIPSQQQQQPPPIPVNNLQHHQQQLNSIPYVRQPPSYQGPPPPPGPKSNNTSFEGDVAYDPDMVRAMNLSRAQALAQKQNHQQHLIMNIPR